MAGSGSSDRPVGVTFVLELPVDLGPAVDGLQLRGAPTVAGRARIFVRRRSGNAPVPLSEAFDGLEAFFSDLVLRGGEDLEFVPRTRRVTVAVVTVLHRTRAKRFAPGEAWLTRRFDQALECLNSFLTGLGFASRSPDVDAVRRTELPAWIPVIVDDRMTENSTPRDVVLTALQLHDFDDGRLVRIDAAAVSTAAWLFDHANQRAAPFRVFIEYVQHARRDLHDGLTHHAVLAACIAVETLVSVALQAIWRVEGDDATSIRRKLEGGFQNLLKDHLRPRVEAAGADPSVIDDWMADCYRLRNLIAHEGFVPHHTAASAACSSTMRLAVELAETLRHDGLAELADSLLLRRPTAQEVGLVELTRLLG